MSHMNGVERTTSIHEMLKNTNVTNDPSHNTTPTVYPTKIGQASNVANTTTTIATNNKPKKETISAAEHLQVNSVAQLSRKGSRTGAADNILLYKTSPSRIETIKNWSMTTYKCTKQLVYEKLGRTNRTVDSELEAEIEQLRDIQQKYTNILQHSRALTNHFYHLVLTQQALGDAFSDLAQKSPELQEEFLYNSETQKSLTKNGETLLGALNFFVSSVNTLCNKTIEDTLQTIRQYEMARIKFDAYRTDLDVLKQTTNSIKSIEDAERDFAQHKDKYERLRTDVSIKLKFLDENRIKVMHKQLLLFHNAVSAYFSGNQSALETTLRQFNIKMKTPNCAFPSWLEQ